MPVPLLSDETVVSALLLTAAVSLIAAAAIPSARLLVTLFKRLTPMQVVVLLTAVGIATASAQKSGTNVVEEASNTNDVAIEQNANGVDIVEGANYVDDVGGSNVTDDADGEATSSLMMTLGSINPALTPGEPCPRVSPADVARGYRLDSVTTNEAISYEVPDDATEVGTWRLTGAYDDVVKVGLGEFRFPLGTNLCASLWAQTWGTVRPRLRSVSNELVAVGAPMSALPGVSRFWTAPTTNATFLITWQGFALDRIPATTNTSYLLPLTSCLVSAQLELCRNGDFVTRSNNVESVYRRVNPDDWDDDGIANDEDDEPTERGDVSFGPRQDYPGALNTNHYCWVDLVVSDANALVTFVGDKPCELADPKFVARAGDTNRVYLLIGKYYAVHCDMPISCVDRESTDIVVQGDEHNLTILWPVGMEFAGVPPLLASPQFLGAPSGGGGGVAPQLTPVRVGGGSFTWENAFCCTSTTSGGVPVFCCNGACGCGGCSTGDITYSYSGYGLDFAGYSCTCGPNDDDGGHGSDDPQGGSGGPGVSASFTTRAVIFEDEYENEPGVGVPRRSTNTGVEFYVYGGTNGGTYAFSIVNGAKLLQVDGGTLPVTGHVAAAESVAVTAIYEAVSPSGGEGDIVAKAEFAEDETGRTLTDLHSALTAVKVEVEPYVSIGGAMRRHLLGVREEVNVNVSPSGVAQIETDDDWLVFGSGANTHYQCPITSAFNGIAVKVGSCEYKPNLTIIEPQGIEGRNVTPETYGLTEGRAGGIGMWMPLHVLPATVSFNKIAMVEEPNDLGVGIGYFNQQLFQNNYCHSVANGAGVWHNVALENYFFDDHPAMSGECPAPWTAGTIIWAIPIAWGEHGSTRMVQKISSIAKNYVQGFFIDAAGSVKIEKFGFWVERSVQGSITHSANVMNLSE